MNVQLSQETLAAAIANVMPATAARSTLPILGNILFTAESDRVTLSATNLEIGIITHIRARATQSGAVTIPAREFSAYINALPPDVVTLTLNPKTQKLKIECAAYCAEFFTVDASEFPVIPTIAANTDRAGIEAETLQTLIARTVFSAAQDDSRPVLVNALTEFGTKANPTLVQFVTADGFRLSVSQATLKRAFDAPQIKLIPAAALKMVSKLARDTDEMIFIAFTPNGAQAIFELADTVLVVNLQDGKFPDYTQIVPKTHDTRVVLNASELTGALKAQNVFARDSHQIVRLDLHPETKNAGAYVFTRSQSADIGQGETSLDAMIDGLTEPMSIAFNLKFLTEAVAVCDTPQVALEITTPASPGVIKPVGRDDFTHVIMPMHLDNMQKPIR